MAGVVAGFGLALGCGGESSYDYGQTAFAVAPAGSDATFTANNLPTSMQPGERRILTVTVRNDGSASPANDWDSSYALRPATGSDFPFAQKPVQGTVATTASTTFNVVLEAPTTPGNYTVAVQMYSNVVGNTGFFGSSISQSVTVSGAATPDYGCTYVSDTLPASLSPSEVRFIDVTVQNSGSQDWPANTMCLYATDSPVDEWGVQTCVNNSSDVTAGSNHTFRIRITAPASTGTFDFTRQMFQFFPTAARVGFFNQSTDCVTLSSTVSGTPLLDATFDTANSTLDEATSMVPGEKRILTVTMQNTGSGTWVASDGYYLVAPNSDFGVPSVGPIPSDVAPGDSYTFTLNITAPSTPGNYTNDWRMLKAGLANFGQSTNVAVNVDSSNTAAWDAAIVSQSTPTSMTRAVTETFSVTVRNTGSNTWSSTDFRLESQNTPAGLWGTSFVALGAAETVAPGDTRTFDIPAVNYTAGTYDSVWRMRWFNGIGFFGSTATTNNIVVTDPCGNGTWDISEECDDANGVDGDACSNSCTINPTTRTIDASTAAGKTLFGPTAARVLNKVAIGDVTGDGTTDVLVGGGTGFTVQVDGLNQIREFAGAVYGVSGGDGFFTDTATSVTSQAMFTLMGARNGDELATYHEGQIQVGDVTGDGVDDIIVAAAKGACANGTGQCGRVYVIRGGSHLATAGMIDLRIIADPVIAVLVAPNDGDRAAALAVGDLSGDGTDDIVIGMPYSDPGGLTDAGSIVVVNGGTLTGTITLSGGNVASTIVGGQAGMRLGFEAAIGQLDGAGNVDLMVGSSGYTSSTGGAQAGGAWGLFSPLAGSIDLEASAPREWNMRWRGPGIRDYLASSFHIGDISGATSDDVILGIAGFRVTGQRFGATNVFAGPFSDGRDQDFVSNNAANVRVQGADAADGSSWCLATGDVNGDGRLDLMMGTPFSQGAGNAQTQAGEFSIVIGGPTLTDRQIDGTVPLTVFNGENLARTCLYRGAIAMGDIDGDGLDDYCIGAPAGSWSASGLGQTGRVDCFRSPY